MIDRDLERRVERARSQTDQIWRELEDNYLKILEAIGNGRLKPRDVPERIIALMADVIRVEIELKRIDRANLED